jgi:hypothetical protein
MPQARLIIRSPGQEDRQVEISGSLSIGRATDNPVRIEDDGVARYHVAIEKLPDGFWLSDLGSEQGTTVNGSSISSKWRLNDGDLVGLGRRSTVRFQTSSPSVKVPEIEPASRPGPSSIPSTPPRVKPQVVQPPPPPGLSKRQITIAVVSGLSAVVIVGSVLVLLLSHRSTNCGDLRISGIPSDSTISEPAIISVSAGKPECLRRASYRIDNEQFARVDAAPYDATLDPARLRAQFPQLSSGSHQLSVVVEDEKGKQQTKSARIKLVFPAKPADESVSTDQAQVRGLSQSFAGQILGRAGSRYVFSNAFADRILALTAQYRADAAAGARPYRLEINKAFSDQGLPLPIGYALAMSQSHFDSSGSTNGCSSDPDGVGLWRIPRAIAQGYLRRDESDAALKDPRRSAEVAAAYVKSLLDAFDNRDDFMYAIACYGRPSAEAGELARRLDESAPGVNSRLDFWRMVEAGVVPRDAADRVACFFAAGIVGENPRSFGLASEPLSSLY